MYRLLLYPCGGMHVHTHQKTALTSTVNGDKIAANGSTNDSTTTRVDTGDIYLVLLNSDSLKANV